MKQEKAEAHLTAAQAADKGDVFILAPNDGTARCNKLMHLPPTRRTSYKVTGQDAEKASVQYIIDGKQSIDGFSKMFEPLLKTQ